ncbi:hypothetical protein LCGC14_2609790, partial [marine sediment metagenome]
MMAEERLLLDPDPTLQPPGTVEGATIEQMRVLSFVPSPLGTMVPVPEGMTSQEVLE